MNKSIPEARPRGGWRGTFSSLEGQDYRWFWFSLIMSFTGMQMTVFARGWLVYDLTGSPLALGWVSFAFGLPLLVLSPICGALMDRREKRVIIIAAQATAVAVNLGVAVLISAGAVAVWHLVVASALTGVAYAFNLPGRQAILPRLVAPHQMMNAIALNSGGQTLSSIAAPPLAGVLVGLTGIEFVYYVSVFFFALSAVLMIGVPRVEASDQERDPSMRSVMLDGLNYVRSKPALSVLLVFAFMLAVIGTPYMALMPAFAVGVLDVGASGMGTLMAASGIGALFGSIAVASMGNFKRKGSMLLTGAVLLGVLLVLFAWSTSFSISLVVLFLTGIAYTIYGATNMTLVQMKVEEQMRGRIMGMYMASYGSIPVGTLAVGAVAEFTSVRFAVGITGAALVALTIALVLFRPEARKL